MRVEPLVSADWLLQRLDEPDIQPVDGTYFSRIHDRDSVDEFRRERIPGAVLFDIRAIADDRPGPPSKMLPSGETFARMVGALGIAPDAHLVVYDAQGLYSGARPWWMFRTFGHDRVSVLDGGLPAWKAAGGPVVGGPPEPRAPTVWPVRDALDLVRDWRQVAENLETGIEQLVDVRPPEQFNGDTSHLHPGVRRGHIPGSINVSQRALRHPDATFRSVEEMRAILAAAGVDLDRPIVATCGGGVTACILSLALEMIRGEPCPVYDGSWDEWGNRPDLPAVVDPPATGQEP